MHTRRIIIHLVLVAVFLTIPTTWAVADADGWRLFRRIEIPAGLPEGPVAIPLDSGIIEKCRPDLADLRVVSSTGTVIPLFVEKADFGAEPEPVPVKIARVAKKPGAWTEISIDKGAKEVTESVLIKTGSHDFVRKVEIRGSDNGKDIYVVRMDGLIISRGGTVGLKDLKVRHPVNNFQFLYIRIIDDHHPPLKVESVLCYPPPAEDSFSTPVSVRTIENRKDASGSTVVIADLGEKRFPLSGITISAKAKSFVKKFTVKGSSSAVSDSWGKIAEGTFFRVTKQDAMKENLSVRFKPNYARFCMLELSGSGSPAVEVDNLKAVGTPIHVVFDYRGGQDYRLFYDNPRAQIQTDLRPPPQTDVQTIASASSGVRLGNAEQNVTSPKTRKWEAPVEMKKDSRLSWRSIGVGMVAAALLVFLGMVLRSRRIRKNRRDRSFQKYHVR